jgi:hypothetical protein
MYTGNPDMARTVYPQDVNAGPRVSQQIFFSTAYDGLMCEKHSVYLMNNIEKQEKD